MVVLTGSFRVVFFFPPIFVEFEVWIPKRRKRERTRLSGLSSSHCEDKSLMTRVRCFLISGSFSWRVDTLTLKRRLCLLSAALLSTVLESDWRDRQSNFQMLAGCD